MWAVSGFFKQMGCNLTVFGERRIPCEKNFKKKGFTVCSIDALISDDLDARIFVAEFKGNGNFEIKPAFTSWMSVFVSLCWWCVSQRDIGKQFHEHFKRESVDFRKSQTQIDRDCSKLLRSWNTGRVLPNYCRLCTNIWDNGVWK